MERGERMKKEELERRFVNNIKQIGIVSHGTMYNKGHWYWSFELKNGERKYWTDLSEESKKILF